MIYLQATELSISYIQVREDRREIRIQCVDYNGTPLTAIQVGRDEAISLVYDLLRVLGIDEDLHKQLIEALAQ